MELLFFQSRNKDDPEVARMKEQAKMVSAHVCHCSVPWRSCVWCLAKLMCLCVGVSSTQCVE